SWRLHAAFRPPDRCTTLGPHENRGLPGRDAHEQAVSDPIPVLERLVTFRSDRMHGNEHALAMHLAELLRGRQADEVQIIDVARPEGTPSAYVYARFGRPRFLVNAHLDTVPPNADWISDPFLPRIDAGRLYALGAADTKGAIAAILCALEEAT